MPVKLDADNDRNQLDCMMIALVETLSSWLPVVRDLIAPSKIIKSLVKNIYPREKVANRPVVEQ